MIPPVLGPNTIRIFAIDPGTSCLGVAALDWEWGAERPKVVWATTLTVKDDRHGNSYAEMRGKRDWRVHQIREQLVRVLQLCEPYIIVTETPFMSRGKLSAFESGVELQYMIRDVVWELFPSKFVHGINPITVKSYVGVQAKGTTKDDMAVAVIKMYKDFSDIDLTLLDEHSIDAIAVANFMWRANLMALGSLVPPKSKNPPRSKKRRPRRRSGRKK